MKIEDLIRKLESTQLIIFSGLPGVGKTFVAKKLAEKLGVEHLQTDQIRRELFTVRTFSRIESGKTHEVLLERAELLLKKGKKVILEATFLYTPGRRKVYATARKLGVPFKVVYITAPEETVKKRLERGRGKRDFSEANFGIYLRMKRDLEERRNLYSLPMEDKGAETIVFENES